MPKPPRVSAAKGSPRATPVSVPTIWTTDAALRLTFRGGAEEGAKRQSERPGTTPTLFDLFRTDDADHPAIAAHRRALGGEAVTVEQIWDGRPVSVRIAPMHAADGAVIGTIGATRPHNETYRRIADEMFNAERFRTIIETALDWIWEIDREGQFTYSNGAVKDMLGYRPEEVLGREAATYISGEDRRLLQSMLPRKIAGREGWRGLVLRWRHADGSWRHLECDAVPILDRAGQLTGWHGTQRDITERRWAEDKLRETANQARSLRRAAERQARELVLLDTVRSVLAREIELSTIFRTIVDAVASSFGYPLVSLYTLEDDVLRLQHQVGYHEVIDRIPTTTGVAGRVVRSGEPALVKDRATDPDFLEAMPGLKSEVCVPLRDLGQVVGVLILESREPVVYDQDDLNLMLALSEHIGVAISRARLFAEARASEARFTAFMDRTPAMAWMKDEQGRFVYANETLRRLFTPIVEPVGQDDIAMFAIGVAGRARGDDQTVLATGEDLEIEEAILLPDGQIRDWLTLKFPFDDASGTRHVGGIAVDMTERRRIEAEVRFSEERFRSLVERSTDLISIVDADGIRRYASPSYERVLGYRADELVGRPLGIVNHPDDAVTDEDAIAKLLDRPGAVERFEARVLHRDGGPRWFEVVMTNRLDDPALAGIVVNSRDVTERKEAEEAVRGSEARFGALVRNAPDLITILDARGVIQYESPSIVGVLGYQPEDLIGHNALDLVHPDDLASVQDRFALTLRTPGVNIPAAFRFQHQDGSWRWLETAGTNLLDDPNVRGIVVNSRDTTDRRRAEERLLHLAYHDPLTGLPNRAALMKHLQEALGRAQTDDRKVALLFIDLDDFKLVNDSRGHEAGDRLLVEIGQRFRRTIEPGVFLARLSGDEFAVVIDSDVSAATAEQTAETLLAALRPAILLDEIEAYTTASIGLALSSSRRRRPGELLRSADIALYEAKAAGRGTYATFQPHMQAPVIARHERETALRRALEMDELRLHYQPLVELESGRIVGLEALARWAHPRHGLLSPADFVQFAEETGLIVPLGRWARREACRWTQAWREATPHGVPLVVSVNLSAREFSRSALIDEVMDALGETGLEPHRLELEITESVALGSDPQAARTLHILKERGVRLAIDDFGTSPSPLGTFRDLPIDTLKIDGAFVGTVAHDQRSQAIVAGITQIAHDLGVQVTAEGVETAEAAAQLRRLGVDRAQGYYFAAPVTGAATAALLRRTERLPEERGEPPGDR